MAEWKSIFMQQLLFQFDESGNLYKDHHRARERHFLTIAASYS